MSVVEQVAVDLPDQVRSLGDRLTVELSGPRDGGFLAILLRIGELLSTSPEGQKLLDLLRVFVRAAGAEIPAAALDLASPVAAFEAVVRGLGALMALESVLAEADRLTALISDQLDLDLVATVTGGVSDCFEHGLGQLAGFVAGMDPNSEEHTEIALEGLAACQARLDALGTTLSAGMGLGEATLVYLDVDRVQAEIEAAAATLRAAELDIVERLLRALVDLVRPVLTIDVESLPSFSLDELLTRLEAKVAEHAATIRAVDVAAVVAPLADGIGVVTGGAARVADTAASVTAAARAALESIRQAIAALPIDQVGDAIRAVLEPVTELIETVTGLVADVNAALGTAAGSATAALGDVELVVDEFKAAVDQLFAEASAFVDGLHLEQVAGDIAGAVSQFADAMAKAQMQPYFDAAAGAIETAADVIDAVPFSLLPDSMKAEVDAAVKPIKDADAGAIQIEIEELLQITDGTFAQRPALEAAIADVQAAYDEVMATLQSLTPRVHVAQIDVRLAEVAAKAAELAPRLTLKPLQDAVDEVKARVAALDPRAPLAPIDAAFGTILDAIDAYRPDALIAPIEERVRAAREKLIETVRLADWAPTLDRIAADGLHLIDVADPARLGPIFRDALEEVQALVDRVPDVRISSAVGSLVALVMSGSGTRMYPGAFEAVVDWLGGVAGAADLTARAGRIADAIGRTRAAVAGVDLTGLAAAATQRLAVLQAAIDAHPDGSTARVRLGAAVVRLDASATLADLDANRARYLTALTRSEGLAETLRRTGLSEVDVVVGRLRTALAPLTTLGTTMRQLARRLGVPGLEDGLVGAVRATLAVVTPERLVGIVMPLFAAFRDRVSALLSAVVTPLKAGVTEITRVVNAIDLTPIREALASVHVDVREQVDALRPSRLLAEPLAAVDAAKAEVAAFDPLAALRTVIDALTATIQRVVAKLDAEVILAVPLAIFDRILAAFGTLDIDALLRPVLDQLDAIAEQVDEGLTTTVEAFRKLQDALPSGPGSEVSVSVSVGIG